MSVQPLFSYFISRKWQIMKVSIELPAGVEPLPNAGFKLVEVGGHAEVLRQPRHLLVLLALASVPAKAEVTRQVPDLGLLRPDLKNMLSQKDRLLHKYCHYPILKIFARNNIWNIGPGRPRLCCPSGSPTCIRTPRS